MIYKHGKRILSLILVILIIVVSTMTVETPSLATNFIDTDNHWAKSYIEMVSSYNVVSGYPDGTFKPDDNIKRIEFIAMIVNSQGINMRNKSEGEYWGQPFIQAALKNDLITYNEYGSMDEAAFNKNISREEMASIVVNAYIKSGGLIDSSAINNVSSSLSDFDKVSPSYYDNSIASVALDL